MAAHVLLLEDDRLIRVGLARLLEACGYVVTVAEGVADCLLRLDGQDMALLDLMLPDGSGTTVLTEIRRRGMRTRVALLTAAVGAPVDLAVSAHRPDGFFPKPIDVDALLRWLATEPPATRSA